MQEIKALHEAKNQKARVRSSERHMVKLREQRKRDLRNEDKYKVMKRQAYRSMANADEADNKDAKRKARKKKT